MKKGTKVLITKTGQIGTVIDYPDDGLLAKVEIITPSGPKIVKVLKAVIQVIEIVDGIWPLLKAIWKLVFPGKNKKVVLELPAPDPLHM